MIDEKKPEQTREWDAMLKHITGLSTVISTMHGALEHEAAQRTLAAQRVEFLAHDEERRRLIVEQNTIMSEHTVQQTRIAEALERIALGLEKL